MEVNKLEPYKEYWMNCHLNALLSIITSVNKTYRVAPLMNNYKYKIEPYELGITNVVPYKLSFEKDIYVEYGKYFEKFSNILDKDFFKIHVKYNTKESVLHYIKQNIQFNNYFLLSVGLNKWINPLMSFADDGLAHYTLIEGYNSKDKTFSVIDDDDNGYGKKIVPEDLLFKALIFSEEAPTLISFNLNVEIKDFKLNLKEINKNAIQLITQLDAIDTSGFFGACHNELNTPFYREYLAYSIGGVTSIRDRQYANILLLKHLNSYKEIDLTNVIILVEEIYSKWKKFRDLLFKDYFRDQPKVTKDISKEFFDEVFKLERQMWESLLVKL